MRLRHKTTGFTLPVCHCNRVSISVSGLGSSLIYPVFNDGTHEGRLAQNEVIADCQRIYTGFRVGKL